MAFSYASKYLLLNHISSSHVDTKNEKTFNCDSCDKIYRQKSHLKRHIAEVHEGKNLFRFDICEKGFTLNSELDKHLDLHEGKELFQRNICNFNFV